MNNNHSNIATIQFNENDVPINFQWSGYAKDVEEFKKYNFLQVNEGDQIYFICSEENGVGLGNYLSRYIFNKEYIFDLEEVYSPGYDYWFFQAWEMAAPFYDELDCWVQEIVEMLISRGYIMKIVQNGIAYFLFSKLSMFEVNDIPNELATEAEKICQTDLIKHFEETLNDYDDVSELSVGDTGKWAQKIMNDFIESYQKKDSKE